MTVVSPARRAAERTPFDADRTPLIVFALAVLYAAFLARMERRFRVKPDHTWAEVAGGVILTLLPVFIARRMGKLDATAFEALIVQSFIASGTPIILWQLGEALTRAESPAPIRPLAAAAAAPSTAPAVRRSA